MKNPRTHRLHTCKIHQSLGQRKPLQKKRFKLRKYLTVSVWPRSKASRKTNATFWLKEKSKLVITYKTIGGNHKFWRNLISNVKYWWSQNKKAQTVTKAVETPSNWLMTILLIVYLNRDQAVHKISINQKNCLVSKNLKKPSKGLSKLRSIPIKILKPQSFIYSSSSQAQGYCKKRNMRKMTMNNLCPGRTPTINLKKKTEYQMALLLIFISRMKSIQASDIVYLTW